MTSLSRNLIPAFPLPFQILLLVSAAFSPLVVPLLGYIQLLKYKVSLVSQNMCEWNND